MTESHTINTHLKTIHYLKKNKGKPLKQSAAFLVTPVVNHEFNKKQINKLRDLVNAKDSGGQTDQQNGNSLSEGFVSESPKASPQHHEDHKGNYP